MYKKGAGNDKQVKDAGNRTLCPYRNFSQAIINTYSMKQPDLYYFQAIKMTSQAQCMENTSHIRVFSVNFDQACDVIFIDLK